MSYIDVYTYDGDSEEYISDEPESAGNRAERSKSFTDGEELAAAEYIVSLLDAGTHFDVRHTRF